MSGVDMKKKLIVEILKKKNELIYSFEFM